MHQNKRANSYAMYNSDHLEPSPPIFDDLTISYDGNQLVKVTDDAEALNYNGTLDFNDGDDSTCEYDYDSNGALTRDSNRGINSITYDYGHHVYKVNLNMTSGPRNIRNDYTPDGRKLSSTHLTHIPTVHGYYTKTTKELYIDGLILRGDTTLLWQFGGGYVELNTNGTPTSWNYYVTDHLGSTRMVVDSNDSIKETISYYPFGSEMQMENPALLNSDSWQRFRFTGQELDRQNSLNMYDFGARWYDVAGVPMWTSMDPLCEKYYSVSPYAYCVGNPINAVDPNGENPVYSCNGIFLGNTKEGFTGQIYVNSSGVDLNYESMTINELLSLNESGIMTYEAFVKNNDYNSGLSDFFLNVITDVLSHFEGEDVFGAEFSISTLYEGQVHYKENEDPKRVRNFTTNRKEGKINIEARRFSFNTYEATVENLASTLIVHEWYGHGVLNYGTHRKIWNIFPAPNHHVVYDLVRKHSLYNKTTEKYKAFVNNNCNYYLENEWSELWKSIK